jgi:hypothetical protein
MQSELARIKDISFAEIKAFKKIRLIGFSCRDLLCGYNRFFGNAVGRSTLPSLLKPLSPVNRPWREDESIKCFIFTFSSDRT